MGLCANRPQQRGVGCAGSAHVATAAHRLNCLYAFAPQLPEFFHNAGRHRAKLLPITRAAHDRPSATSVSSKTYRILATRAGNYADEMRFYEEAKKLFELKWTRLLANPMFVERVLWKSSLMEGG